MHLPITLEIASPQPKRKILKNRFSTQVCLTMDRSTTATRSDASVSVRTKYVITTLSCTQCTHTRCPNLSSFKGNFLLWRRSKLPDEKYGQGNGCGSDGHCCKCQVPPHRDLRSSWVPTEEYGDYCMCAPLGSKVLKSFRTLYPALARLTSKLASLILVYSLFLGRQIAMMPERAWVEKSEKETVKEREECYKKKK